MQSQIHSVIINKDEIKDKAEIKKQIFSFINLSFRIKFRSKQTKHYQNLPMNNH